jgi:DNA polymerase
MLFDVKCKACKLAGVTVPGEGPTEPKVIVVSDYPGGAEVKFRRPMMGPSGKLLRAALSSYVGLDIEKEVFITNVLKCAPKDMDVTARELNTCRSWINKEFKQVKCKLFLVCGEKAKNSLLPHLADQGISALHGHVYADQLTGNKYVITWNPATIEQFSAFDEDGERLFTTGSVPWLFLKDLDKLKALLAETYG